MGVISFDDFKKVEIITARIEKVRDHPNADKLFILEVNTGETKKELVAGIKNSYAKEDLVGKDIVMINNLEPAVIRGVGSKGMLLAVQGEKGVSIIMPDRTVKPGSKVR